MPHITLKDRVCPQCGSLLSIRKQKYDNGVVVFCLGECKWVMGLDKRIIKAVAVKLYKELSDSRNHITYVKT